MPLDPALTDATAVRRPRRTMIALWSAILSLVFVLGSSQKAEATCGDYLGQHAQLGEPHEASVEHPIPSDREPTQPGCHGPLCRKNQPHAPIPTPVTSYDDSDQWIWLRTDRNDAHEPFMLQHPSSDGIVGLLISQRLERPPKSNSL